jgi:hypothetical protein
LRLLRAGFDELGGSKPALRVNALLIANRGHQCRAQGGRGYWRGAAPNPDRASQGRPFHRRRAEGAARSAG